MCWTAASFWVPETWQQLQEDSAQLESLSFLCWLFASATEPISIRQRHSVWTAAFTLISSILCILGVSADHLSFSVFRNEVLPSSCDFSAHISRSSWYCSWGISHVCRLRTPMKFQDPSQDNHSARKTWLGVSSRAQASWVLQKWLSDRWLQRLIHSCPQAHCYQTPVILSWPTLRSATSDLSYLYLWDIAAFGLLALGRQAVHNCLSE